MTSSIFLQDKFSNLVAFLRNNKDGKKLIFLGTCAAVEYFGKIINNIFKNTDVLLLHGQMKKKREAIFSKFRLMERGTVLPPLQIYRLSRTIPQVVFKVAFFLDMHCTNQLL